MLAALALGAAMLSPGPFSFWSWSAARIVAWEWGRLTRGNGFDGTALLAGRRRRRHRDLRLPWAAPIYALFMLAAAAVAIG